METLNSFKGYGKVNELDQQELKKKTRKRFLIICFSIVFLILLVVGVVAGTVLHSKNKSSSGDVPVTRLNAIKAICNVTLYPDSCFATLSSSESTDPENIFRFSLMVARDSLQKLSTLPEDYVSTSSDPAREALSVCRTVLNDGIESLNDSISATGNKLSSPVINNLKTWLSAALTNQETCIDALEEANATFVEEVKLLMKNSMEYTSNSLAIVSRLIQLLSSFKIPIHRRLLSTENQGLGFPAWVSAKDRRLLQASQPQPDVTVAKDGTGNVTTITEAMALIPKKNLTRFVVHIKAGEYVENIVLDKSHWNVMIYGDGQDSTIISGGKNFINGTPTFSTATFAVVGKGFIARDIGFKNTAGAAMHQAVALRSGSDQSVFYRCSFDGFQDTLYAHSNRQFYRECKITGTIDFIFGNSAVVLQKCNILPRQPLSNQFVTITAQGKKDPNQNTGISIQRCSIRPLDNLTAPTYLGRPWKEYSTTVIMQSDIGGFLNPSGWVPWIANVDPPKTIFYGEYLNTGPGSDTVGRVNWTGFSPNLAPSQASKFNVQSFIQGDSWLPDTSVTFDSI